MEKNSKTDVKKIRLNKSLQVSALLKAREDSSVSQKIKNCKVKKFRGKKYQVREK